MSKFALILAGIGNTENIERSLANVFERQDDNYETFVADVRKPETSHDHYAELTPKGITELVDLLKKTAAKTEIDELVIYVEDDRVLSMPENYNYTDIAKMLDGIRYKNRVVVMNKVSEETRSGISKIFMDDPMTLCVWTKDTSGTNACQKGISKFWDDPAEIKHLYTDGWGDVGWNDRLASAIESVSPNSACGLLFSSTPDNSMDFIYTAPVLVKAGLKEDAKKILKDSINDISAEGSTHNPELLEDIASIMAVTELEYANQIFEQLLVAAGNIKDRKKRLSVIAKISDNVTKRGLADVNHRTLMRFLLAAGSIKDDETRFLVLKGVTAALVDVKDHGLDVFEKFVSIVAERARRRNELRSLIFRNIAFNLAGQAENLEQFISATENAEHPYEDPYFQTPALREIAFSLARAGLKDKAVAIFKKALVAADKTSDEPSAGYEGRGFRTFAIGKITAAVNAAKLPDIELFGQLLSAAKKIKDPQTRHSVFTGILENFQVIVVANNMDPKIRSQLIGEIVSAQDELTQGGSDILDIFFAAMDKIEDPSLRSKFFRETACELSERGQTTEANTAFHKSIEAAKKIEHLDVRGENFFEIVSSALHSKEALGDKIDPILDAILAETEKLSPYAHSNYLSKIARVFAVAKMIDRAKKALDGSLNAADRISESYDRSIALINIASDNLTTAALLGAEFQDKLFDAFLKSIISAEEVKDSLRLSTFFGVITTSRLVSEKPAQGNVNKAVEIFDRLVTLAEKNGVHPEVLAKIRGTLFEISTTSELVNEKRTKGNIGKTIQIFMRTIALAEKSEASPEVLAKIRAVLGKLKKLKPMK